MATVAIGQPLASRKLAPELTGLDPNTTVDVIVKYNQEPTGFHRANAERLGARMVHSLELIKSHHYRMTADRLAELAEDPAVEYIHPDREVRATGSSVPVQPDYGWVSLLNLSSPFGSVEQDGSNIGVAIIDSGISANADLQSGEENQSRVVYSQSFVPGDNSTNDAYGHGTHVAGIAGGDGSNSLQSTTYVVKGLATNVSLINLRVLDSLGASSDSVVIAAIQQAVALKHKYNIRVINLSLGRPVATSYKNDPLCQAVEAAWNAGIVVVVAAGNNGRYSATAGYGTITSPGNDPYVITVGAMNTNATLSRSDDKMASYSSKGPTAIDFVVKPDLVAPGNRILSVLASNSTLAFLSPASILSLLTGGARPYYFQLSGTSMAAPAVSGAAALLLQQNSSLTPDQVKAKLMLTASKTFPAAVCPAGATCPTQAYETTTATDAITGVAYKTYYDVFTVGAGYLDVNKALTTWASPSSSLSAVSPSASYNATTGAVTLVNGSGVIWGSSTNWGTSVIWGTNVLSGNSVIWGTGIIWGTNAPAASSVIWGTGIIWGTDPLAAEGVLLSLLGEQ